MDLLFIVLLTLIFLLFYWASHYSFASHFFAFILLHTYIIIHESTLFGYSYRALRVIKLTLTLFSNL